MPLDLDRYTEIEKENRRLLEKMTGMIKGRRKHSIFSSKHNPSNDLAGQHNQSTRQNIEVQNMSTDKIY